jgi:quaternary ammonium compound-resistance protein SugE
MNGSWINPWVALVIAGVLEIVWASGFKYVSPQRPLTSIGVGMTMAASFYFLWVATQKLPIGTAYAIWTGIGAVGAASVGILLFGEPATALRILCIVLIVAGIVGLKLFSGAH